MKDGLEAPDKEGLERRTEMSIKHYDEIEEMLSLGTLTPKDIHQLLAHAWTETEILGEEVDRLLAVLRDISSALTILGPKNKDLFPPEAEADYLDLVRTFSHEKDGEFLGKITAAIDHAARSARSIVASNAVAMKLSKDTDGKQAAKAEARKLWADWQTGKTIHRSAAAFARFVVKTLPVIESEEAVKRWEREWRKEAGKNSDAAS